MTIHGPGDTGLAGVSMFYSIHYGCDYLLRSSLEDEHCLLIDSLRTHTVLGDLFVASSTLHLRFFNVTLHLD